MVGIDALLEWTTYRMVAASVSLFLLGIGGMNERRALVGASLSGPRHRNRHKPEFQR